MLEATDQDEGFRVTDRRGHARDETPPAAALPPAAEPASPPAPDAVVLPGDLRPLIVMLANVALLALEASPESGIGGEGQIDLAQAEEAIEGLLTLRDRTDGRRTGEESALLERGLDEIQFRYTESAPPPPRR